MAGPGSGRFTVLGALDVTGLGWLDPLALTADHFACPVGDGTQDIAPEVDVSNGLLHLRFVKVSRHGAEPKTALTRSPSGVPRSAFLKDGSSGQHEVFGCRAPYLARNDSAGFEPSGPRSRAGPFARVSGRLVQANLQPGALDLSRERSGRK